MKTILFQGDSITDCGRNRNEHWSMGDGYPQLIKGQLGFEYREQFDFRNTGVSGDRIIDLYARIKKDIINLKPDYMSVLIGSNDAWQEVNYNTGASPEKYEKLYLGMTDIKKKKKFTL